MSIDPAELLFNIIAFLFAISVHEAAHAYVALRCGDQTAFMLGRVTLNPISHIDIMGTLLVPALAMYYGGYMIGWAKPTPVNPRHFRHGRRDDILVSLAGPASNLIVAAVSTLVLVIFCVSSPLARDLVHGAEVESTSALVPLVYLFKYMLYINVLLAVFNVIPVPPLDGSHVLRHFLPEGARQMYDRIGMFGLLIIFLVGGRFISAMMSPILAFFGAILSRF